MTTGAFQMWNLDTGNCFGAYDDEQTGLTEVRAGVAEDGPGAWANAALLRAGEQPDDLRPLAEGRTLVEPALAASHDFAPVTA
ncbi:MAG: hypothetical protein AVDCRST_MAG18-2282 [uncultured Thermomicrobiales bacterium]|uniref:Uncharacterized protein n=1 Tax=uncultured Thermomicrobiales bacterium TaxID=1645740 RepID=A0A6J4VF36_9BACT|nr:MAG: hypothetical protein AVDCRST_MAG18-2282 [uncultured Thermomicrobiales bacterium]